jgi:hypothetical protein
VWAREHRYKYALAIECGGREEYSVEDIAAQTVLDVLVIVSVYETTTAVCVVRGKEIQPWWFHEDSAEPPFNDAPADCWPDSTRPPDARYLFRKSSLCAAAGVHECPPLSEPQSSIDQVFAALPCAPPALYAALAPTFSLPKRIILMRHGESLGNVDDTVRAT